MERLLFHIGYPKCASSSLQRHLSQCQPYINYLGFQPSGCNSSFDQFFFSFLKLNSVNFDTSGPDYYRVRFQEYLSADRLNVVSAEHVLSPSTNDIGLQAKKLKALKADARLLVIIRRQEEYILSDYYWRPHAPISVSQSNGRILDLEAWLNCNLQNYDRSILSALDYHRVLSHYERYFPQSNIHVLLYEDLAQSPEQFLQQLSDILGLPSHSDSVLTSNQKSNTWQANVLRRYKRTLLPNVNLRNLMPRRMHSALAKMVWLNAHRLPLLKDRKPLPKHLARQVRHMYAESNRRLAETYNLPLEDYDYSI